MSWTQVLPGVWRYRDSCNVWAVRGPRGVLIVDAGTGAWVGDAGQLPAEPVALACTHFFRDHSSGALAASRSGIPVWVPEGERAIFADPVQHFRQRETYIIYDNLWDLYAPIEGVPVAGVLRDYEKIRPAGLEVEVLPLPGVTLTQVGLAVTLEDGRRVVFSGEAIHSPGRMARIAPLQYDYNDLYGAADAIHTARMLRARKPDALLPSLGEPILGDVDGALAQLETNLAALAAVRPELGPVLASLDTPPLTKITDHVYLDAHSIASTWYVVSDSSKVLAIDYGYHRLTCSAWPAYPKPERRRALLHGLDALKSQLGIDGIDVVLVSHFHDDHIAGIPVLQRLGATRCWAAESFADLLAEPESHCFPCTWPVPIRVDRRLPLDETFRWEEYTFRLHPMNGHTRFSALIGFEADGKRYAHTGDQYFFHPWNGDMKSFTGTSRMQNHVYRNGALLDGYDLSAEWMQTWKPDIVIQGHQPAMMTDAAFFDHIEGWRRDYAGLHRAVMPLGADEEHRDLDSWGGWIWPYRIRRDRPEPFRVRVTVRNPSPRAARLEVRLVGPTGWTGSGAVLEAAGRAEVSADLVMEPRGVCRRQPIAVDLKVDGKPMGQVAEALVTLGESAW